MNTTNVSIATCVHGYKPVALGVPVPLALILTVPLSVVGTVLNGFALILLASLKQFTNQDIYVIALSASGMVMAGPCLFLFTYGNVNRCYDFPQIISDIRIFLVQVSAGLSIWLVVMISVDRLMMLYFKVHYPTKVTKKMTITGILALVAWYVIICGAIVTSPYFFGTYKVSPLSLHPRFVMVASFVETPTPVSYGLNLMRMVTDRMLPWVMCTATYIIIFSLRDRHKRRLNPSQPSLTQVTTVPFFQPSARAQAEAAAAVKDKKAIADQRAKRSRFLVIGITASLFICLTPETIFDISSYIFGVVLRKNIWEVLGIVWYCQTILNPVIYIISFPNLRSKAKQLFKTVAEKMERCCAVKEKCSCKCKCSKSTKVKQVKPLKPSRQAWK